MPEISPWALQTRVWALNPENSENLMLDEPALIATKLPDVGELWVVIAVGFSFQSMGLGERLETGDNIEQFFVDAVLAQAME